MFASWREIYQVLIWSCFTKVLEGPFYQKKNELGSCFKVLLEYIMDVLGSVTSDGCCFAFCWCWCSAAAAEHSQCLQFITYT
jgi:hypothetical protein